MNAMSAEIDRELEELAELLILGLKVKGYGMNKVLHTWCRILQADRT